MEIKQSKTKQKNVTNCVVTMKVQRNAAKKPIERAR